MSYFRSAASGAAATLVWAAVEPIDTRLVRWDYSDVALLGKAVTRSRAWPAAGLAIHVANGAVFGLGFEWARRRLPTHPQRLALGMALAEHVTLYPIGIVVDRVHPARGQAGMAPTITPRGFALATFRHALFGVVLGRLARTAD